MSGYVEGILVLLAINIVFAYGAFLPIAAGQLNLGVAGFAAIGGYVSAYLSNTAALSALIAIPLGALAAGAVYAGADTTFTPALTKFTDFLEGSGGKIITVLSLAGGLIGLASGRFSLSQVAVPVGVGIGVGTGVPIVTSVVTAVI